MMKLNLQLFGGRGSNGGNSQASAVKNAEASKPEITAKASGNKTNKGVSLTPTQKKVVAQAAKNLDFTKGYAEISANHWDYAHMSNEKMAKALTAQSTEYSYEIKTKTEKGNMFTNNAAITRYRIYRKKKG